MNAPNNSTFGIIIATNILIMIQRNSGKNVKPGMQLT